MTILSLENASFAVGHVPLLDHTAFQLAQGEKIGLIGRNGAGKSSLLKILAGAQKLDDGQLIIQSSLKIVYVPQESVFPPEASVFDIVSEGLGTMRDVLRRYHQISHELEHSQNNDLIKELNTLQNQIEAQNGWQFDAAIRQTISELGLPENEIIVNVQGDEPMIPPALINRVAEKLANSHAPMATAAHPVHDFAEFQNPNCVKVVLSQAHNALYFSRAPIAYPRDIMQSGDFRLPVPAPLRHIGIYAYRAGFLQQYAAMSASPLESCESLEQLRVLWHGYPIAVEVLAEAPPAGVDTPADLDRVRREWAA